MVAIPMGASEDQWAEVSALHRNSHHLLDSLHYTGGQAED